MVVKRVVDETGQKVPVKIWTEDVDEASVSQLIQTASLPFVFKHVAAMPDVHLGKGATIGSVIATKRAIVPAAVGVDVGCGMMAVKTHFSPAGLDRKAIRRKIEERVPLGPKSNLLQPDSVKRWNRWDELHQLEHVDSRLFDRAYHQMGSLGGGNHFIEICLDEEDALWVMLHSGSRFIGNHLATRYIKDAKSEMALYHVDVPNRDLAYLSEGTQLFTAYMRTILWLQDYAFQNRIEMMGRVLETLADETGQAIERSMEVNCHHNYAEMENHFGANVWITRKGAVRARKGDLGIIPGSMGASSFIVRGLGNPESFMSCAHGAGRRMSRTAAKKRFTSKDLERQTKGVECRKDGGVVDEIPAAYKDIDEVMANQDDLVEIISSLHQIICVKG